MSLKDEVEKKIAKINDAQINRCLDEEERYDSGMIKDHMGRLMQNKMNENAELVKQNHELLQRNAELLFSLQKALFEIDVKDKEIERLNDILGKRDFKVVK